MKKILAITIKELNSYFKSPTAYIILFITTVTFNVFFFVIIDQNREASLRDMFKLMEFLFLFIVPILTMRLFAEEKRSGSMEFLLTCPVKISEIILGKYLGSLIFFAVIVSLTIPHYLIVEFFSQPDRGQVATGYFGILLEGMLFVAVGTMASSWTKSQIIAAITSYVILLFLYFLPSALKHVDTPWRILLENIGFLSRTENFTSGLIISSDVVYYLSVAAFCLLVTQLNISRIRR